MDTEQSRHIVINAWKAFASQDPAQAAPFFAEDAVWIAPKDNATAVALGAPSGMTGRDVIARFLTQGFHRLFREVQIDFLGVYADGDTVVVEERMRATVVNGRAYDMTYVFVFKLEVGKIKLMREYMDTLTAEMMIFDGERAHRLDIA
ncbi:nuclear transport factor 2 family protein [Phenylobacterium sp.]|uniref:nuclear transport factor 2 family protein n=1 Tax=Phenylobacterium sp. TaxID=1871053 RepID=UPI00286C231C|nr:nuclear transport factor 2 family protein [Phenylobacterium sp.]